MATRRDRRGKKPRPLLPPRAVAKPIKPTNSLPHTRLMELEWGWHFVQTQKPLFSSEAAGTRTQDQRIKSPMLYRLSYSLGDNPTEAGNGSNGGDVQQAAEPPPGTKRADRKTAEEMPGRGLEPPPSYLDKNLNLARLPIPPLGRVRPRKRQDFDATNARPGRK